MDVEKLADKIFALLKGNGLKIKLYDVGGNETTDPTQARRFFAADPNILVSLDLDNNHIEFSKGGGVNPTADRIAAAVRRIASEFMADLRVKVFGKAIRPKDYAYQAKAQRNTVMEETAVNHLVLAQVLKQLDYSTTMSAAALVKNIPGSDLNEVQKALNRLVKDGKATVTTAPGVGGNVYSKKMEEAVGGLYENFSRLYGSRRTSRQVLEDVQLIIRHRKDVDDSVRGARGRSISAIFLEHAGVRTRFPHAHLGGARAMAQHISRGGSSDDHVGTYITESTGKLMTLREFARYASRNQLINEDTQPVMQTVKAALLQITESLKRLAGARSYETACARVSTPGEPAGDIQQLQELFTRHLYDQQLNTVLPIVQSLLEQQDEYRSHIEAAANGVVTLRNTPITDIPVLEFTCENSRLGYKISELALRITDNQQLSEFVSAAGKKLSKGQQLDVFESTVIARVLENSVINNSSDVQTVELTECRDFERALEQYNLRFL